MKRRTFAVAARPLERLAWAAFAAALLTCAIARAERGLFALSLSSGQAASVTPVLGTARGVPLVAGFEYGFSERWAGALVAGVEWMPHPTLTLSLGPRATLFRNDWWTLDALLAPELLRVGPARLDLGARLGLSVRYQLMWGVGIGVEASVRGRAPATGRFSPELQGLLLAGLYIES